MTLNLSLPLRLSRHMAEPMPGMPGNMGGIPIPPAAGVAYIFVLSFYLVFVLLMVMLLKTTGSFQGSRPSREGTILTIGQTPKDGNKEQVYIIIFSPYKRICNHCKFAGLSANRV